MTSELVTNAVMYSASGLPGGAFTVSVRARDGSVRVDVTDEGEAPRSAAVPGGLGKGLLIVSQLADVFGADGADRGWGCALTAALAMLAMTGYDSALSACGVTSASWALP